MFCLFRSECICCDCGFNETRLDPGADKGTVAPYVDREGNGYTDGGGTTVIESHGVVYGPGGQGCLPIARTVPYCTTIMVDLLLSLHSSILLFFLQMAWLIASTISYGARSMVDHQRNISMAQRST
ncbi:hypothetical protein PG997_012919 [Apiospora hydei]|uniref:Uncharacterized protein n=1 Tax=Apiospora hydei TaxID=1337664 RepID=A0ABR1V5I9_9PEZI